MDYRYFKVTGGPVMKALDAALQTARERHKERVDFRDEHGAIGVWGNWHGVAGLIFPIDTPIPAGWRQDFQTCWKAQEVSVAVPDKCTKAGKQIAKHPAMTKPLWELEAFYKALGASDVIGGYGTGLALYYAGAERLSGTWYVKVPIGKPSATHNEAAANESWQPPEGMEEVRGSDYLRAKEDAAE